MTFSEQPNLFRKNKKTIDTSHWKESPETKNEKFERELEQIEKELEKLDEILHSSEDTIALPDDLDEEILKSPEKYYSKLHKRRSQILRELGRDPLLD